MTKAHTYANNRSMDTNANTNKNKYAAIDPGLPDLTGHGWEGSSDYPPTAPNRTQTDLAFQGFMERGVLPDDLTTELPVLGASNWVSSPPLPPEEAATWVLPAVAANSNGRTNHASEQYVQERPESSGRKPIIHPLRPSQ